MLQIAVCGKPNVGKSSFFNSATASTVEMANYPFTTIDANKAVAHVINELSRKHAKVIFQDTHVSGHACAEEIKLI